VRALEQQLTPALRELSQVLHGGRAAELERAASLTRRAVEQVQGELRQAQEAVVQRDPLVAGKWFAEQAATALAARPPRLKEAQDQQHETSQALARAWDGAIREAAAQRLAGLPHLQAVYAGGTGGQAQAGGEQGPEVEPVLLPPLRQWGQVRLSEEQSPTYRHRMDPPGYQEALRIYFDSLGRGP
jgi:hypothetical protein